MITKNKLTTILLGAAMVLGTSAFSQGTVLADSYTGWKNTNNIWRYSDHGNNVRGWFQHNSKWYFFNENGDMKTGWILHNNKWYYLSQNGDMTEGIWVCYNNKWYYLNNDGTMAVNTTTPDGYAVGGDGSWISNVNKVSDKDEKDIDQDEKKIDKEDIDQDEQEADEEDNEIENITYIGKDKAKEIAITDANLSESDLTFKKIALDNDDHKPVYEVEFYNATREYEYEINAVTGDIIECKIDVEDEIDEDEKDIDQDKQEADEEDEHKSANYILDKYRD